MDFNKAFTNYSSIDGGKCQTQRRKVSQKDAAIEAVEKIGLNQVAEVKKEWFSNMSDYEMFEKRLDILRAVDQNR